MSYIDKVVTYDSIELPSGGSPVQQAVLLGVIDIETFNVICGLLPGWGWRR